MSAMTWETSMYWLMGYFISFTCDSMKSTSSCESPYLR